MALNFLGMGFSFGAKDAGLRKMQQAVSEGFKGIEGSVDHINLGGVEANLASIVSELRGFSDQFKQVTNKVVQDERRVGSGFDAISQALDKVKEGIRQLKISNIAAAFQLNQLRDVDKNLEQLAGTNQNLTTSYEAQLVAHDKVTKATGANMGFLGEKLTKFRRQATSIAVGLNISADSAAMAVRGWTEAQEALSATGLKNASDLAKLSEVTGVSANVFRNSSLQMRKEFKLSTKQIDSVFKSMLDMGRATGDVGGALNELPQTMERLRQKAALMGEELDPAQLADFAKQQAALSTGFFQMGQNSDQARASAGRLTDAILEGQKNLQNMMAGTDDDIGALAQELGIGTGDIAKSFELMQQGPAGFTQGLFDMVQQSKAMGKFTPQALDFLRARLEKAMGPEMAAQLTTFFTSANEKTFAMMKRTQTATTSLKTLADQGFSTGRTLSDQMELAHDQMVTSFRGISRESARTFVRDTRKQFKTFSKGLQSIAEEKGPLGAIVRKMSEIHQLGPIAFAPEPLRPFVGGLGDLMKALAPIAIVISAVGASVLAWAAVIAIPLTAIAALVGWFVKLRGEGKTTEEALQTIADGVVGFFEKLPEKIGEFLGKAGEFGEEILSALEKIDWVGIITKLAGAVSEGFDKLGTSIDWAGVFTKLASSVSEGLDTLGAAIDWAGLGETLGKAGGTAFLWLTLDLPPMIRDALSKVFPILGEVLAKAVGILKEFVLGMITGIGQSLAEKFPEHAETIMKVFQSLRDAVGTVFDIIGFAIEEGLKGWGMLMTAVNESGGIFSFIGDFVMFIWDGLKQLAGFILGGLWAAIKGLGGLWYDFVTAPITAFFDFVLGIGTKVIDAFKKVGSAIADAFKNPLEFFEKIKSLADSLFGNSIDDDVRATMKSAEGFFSSSTDKMAQDMARIADMTPTAGGGLRTPGRAETSPAQMAPAIGRAELSLLIEAVHTPRWYYEDFKPMFQGAMQAAENRARTGAQVGRRGALQRAASTALQSLGYEQRLATAANGVPTTDLF